MSRTSPGSFCGKRLGHPFGPARVHQKPRALQIARASQARREDEMSFEQRIRLAEFCKDFLVGHEAFHLPRRRNRRARRGFNRSQSALEGGKAAPIRPPNRGLPAATLPTNPLYPGVRMKRIGWAIALAAAWRHLQRLSSPHESARDCGIAMADPSRDGRHRQAESTDPATPASGRSARGANTLPPRAAPTYAAPTPGIGVPDGRMGVQTR
jgi:hypothetical protein